MSRRVPNIPQPNPKNLEPTVSALVGVVAYVTAQSQAKILPLPSTASTADIINKINELLARIQGT
jgi:hypothetical protein